MLIIDYNKTICEIRTVNEIMTISFLYLLEDITLDSFIRYIFHFIHNVINTRWYIINARIAYLMY